ncbi:hypothetical protein FIBSPDRAFT_903228 [Athelia psychrophila]|uniref:CxC5 like cysteine cluster associated with KDZ domain-containing protein n=1 Tax=Athelia psychrophila TaxID=1759441 RepID=A0A167W9Z1_9AGAM|nr:hypothetical protein FIBSPDRAFT_903228 [Fibularhizoctonia sp. CBS 109695]
MHHSWERMPFAAVAATAVVLIQAAPLFVLDRRQRAAGVRQRAEGAWIKNLTWYIDERVLPMLPGQFGGDYTTGIRLTTAMVYDMAAALGLGNYNDNDPPEVVLTQLVSLPIPLVPARHSCPQCPGQLPLHYRQTNHPDQKIWVFGPSQAQQTIVMAGRCPNCNSIIWPDRLSRIKNDGTWEDKYFKNSTHIQIGRDTWATCALGHDLGVSVTTAHLPLATFTKCWNESIRKADENIHSATISQNNLWQLY